MAYSLIDQVTLDLDIFLKSPFPHFSGIHIATAGGVLPERVAEFDIQFDQNAILFTKFERQYNYRLNPNLNEIVYFESAFNRELYIEDFIDKARKGFFTFDKSDINAPFDKFYHLVAYPLPNISYNKRNLLINETKIDDNIFRNIIRNQSDFFEKIELFKNI